MLAATETVPATPALSTPLAPLPKASAIAAEQQSQLARLRSRVFNVLFLGYTFLFVLAVHPLLLARTRRPLARAMQIWAKGVLALMSGVAGIRTEFRGRENLPKSGPYILASKHQSEADGIAMLALVGDLAFVAMKEVAMYPFVGPILKKLEMVLVDTDGGARERSTLAEGGRAAAGNGRAILIYPEGTLMKVGERGRFRAGVYHLAADLGIPVIPVATDIGRFWDRRQPMKRAGTGTFAFLPAIKASADKRDFMAALEETIEAECTRLANEARA